MTEEPQISADTAPEVIATSIVRRIQATSGMADNQLASRLTQHWDGLVKTATASKWLSTDDPATVPRDYWNAVIAVATEYTESDAELSDQVEMLKVAMVREMSTAPDYLAAHILAELENQGVERQALADRLDLTIETLNGWLKRQSVAVKYQNTIITIAEEHNLTALAGQLRDLREAVKEAAGQPPTIAMDTLNALVATVQTADLEIELPGYIDWIASGRVPAARWENLRAAALQHELRDQARTLNDMIAVNGSEPALRIVLRNVAKREGERRITELFSITPSTFSGWLKEKGVPPARRMEVVTQLEVLDLGIVV